MISKTRISPMNEVRSLSFLTILVRSTLFRTALHKIRLPPTVAIRLFHTTYTFVLFCIATVLFTFLLSQSTRNTYENQFYRGYEPIQPYYPSHFNHFRMTDRFKYFPSIEVFMALSSTEQKFLGNIKQSIKSWRDLRPLPRITLLGNFSGIEEFCQDMNINFDVSIDRNFLNSPKFSSVIYRVNQSDADVVILAKPGTYILPDLYDSIHKLYAKFSHFLALGATYNIQRIPSKEELKGESIRSYISRTGVLQNDGSIQYWVWTTGGPPIISGKIPPFITNRGKHDNWLLHEAVEENKRPVVDLSEVVFSYTESSFAKGNTFNDINDNRTKPSTSDVKYYEEYMNVHVSLKQHNLQKGLGTPLHAPWKYTPCDETDSCLHYRFRAGMCVCEYSTAVSRLLFDTCTDEYGRAKTVPVDNSRELAREYILPVHMNQKDKISPGNRFGLPLSWEDALSAVHDRRHVILIVANFNEKEQLMNFLCIAHRQHINNVILAALDKEIYRFATMHGVASVFMTLRNQPTDFEKFQVTMHSIHTILKHGYDVTWCNVALVIRKNPFEFFQSRLKNSNISVLMQSNAEDNKPANSATDDELGIVHFKRSKELMSYIFKDFAKRNLSAGSLSDMNSFYGIFCGDIGQHRNELDYCLVENIYSAFLSRENFPNGQTKMFWSFTKGQLRLESHVVAVLNNFVNRNEEKINRLIEHGLQIYDDHKEICI